MVIPAPPALPAELPADIDGIDLDWLGAVLGIEGARVIGYRHGRHAGGFGVTSLVTRLHLELDRPAAGPHSVIAKLPNPGFARTQLNCEAEIDFYLRVASALPLPAPRCYFGGYDSASGRSLLLLEDLSDARPGHPVDAGCDLLQARAALVALARMQAATWCAPELERLGLQRKPLFPDLAAWLDDTARLFAALRSKRRYPISALTARSIAAALERLSAHPAELDRGPFALVHDDLHTQNILLDAGSAAPLRVVFLDWQDTALGHPARDLCQLLGANVRVDIQRQHAATLLHEYQRTLAQHGVDAQQHDEVVRALPVAAARMALGYVRFLSEHEVRSPGEQATLNHEWERVVTMLHVVPQLVS